MRERRKADQISLLLSLKNIISFPFYPMIYLHICHAIYAHPSGWEEDRKSREALHFKVKDAASLLVKSGWKSYMWNVRAQQRTAAPRPWLEAAAQRANTTTFPPPPVHRKWTDPVLTRIRNFRSEHPDSRFTAFAARQLVMAFVRGLLACGHCGLFPHQSWSFISIQAPEVCARVGLK